MPQAGKVYMEGKEIDSLEDVRKLWNRWISGRQKGNYLKPRLGDFRGERAVIKTEKKGVGFTGITCFSCGTKGHRAVDCPKGRSFDTSRKPAESRPVTFYNYGK